MESTLQRLLVQKTESVDLASIFAEEYPKEFLDGIADEFGIPSDARSRNRFRSRVLMAAFHYRDVQAQIEEWSALNALRAEVDRIEQGVSTALTNLSDPKAPLKTHFDAGIIQLRGQWPVEASALNALGLDPAQASRSEEETLSALVRRQDLIAHLERLATMCQMIRAGLTPPRRGPKHAAGLHIWIGMMCDYWEEELGRRVTFSHLGGGLVQSDIYPFLGCLFQRLEPKLGSRLRTGLRRERTRRRNRRNFGSPRP